MPEWWWGSVGAWRTEEEVSQDCGCLINIAGRCVVPVVFSYQTGDEAINIINWKPSVLATGSCAAQKVP